MKPKKAKESQRKPKKAKERPKQKPKDGLQCAKGFAIVKAEQPNQPTE